MKNHFERNFVLPIDENWEAEREECSVVPIQMRAQKEAEHGFITGDKLVEVATNEVHRLVDPIFNKVGIFALVGSSDCGKSTFLRQLAIAVAQTRREFLGYQLNVRHGKVLYICTEDNLESTASALKKQIGKESVEDLKNIKFRFDNEEETYSIIEKELEKEPVDLIVLDAWADLFDGSTNSVKDVRGDFKKLKSIANKHETAIIILHHLVKSAEKGDSNKNKVNGSQAIEASVRSVVEIRSMPETNETFLIILKGNNISKENKAKALKLFLNEERLLFTTDAEFVDINEIGVGQRKRKYDSKIIIDRLLKLKEENSFANTRKELVEEFGEDAVPKLTRLKAMHEEGKISRSL